MLTGETLSEPWLVSRLIGDPGWRAVEGDKEGGKENMGGADPDTIDKRDSPINTNP